MTLQRGLVALVAGILATGCRLDDNPITISPSTGTTLTNAQTMTLLAVIDAAALRARLGDEAASASHVEFRHRAEAQSGTDFAVICVDDKPPYACDWSVTAADNGTHQWVAALFTAQGKILGMAGTEIHVEIPAPRGLPRPSADCSDGVDCFCDRVKDPNHPIYDPGIIFCEDFEDPALNDGGNGWVAKYGNQNHGCWSRDESGDWLVEGTCEDCCINILQDDVCEVAGDDDCVFEGGQSLGHRLQPGKTGGIVGRGSWDEATDQFGVTYAMRYAPNFIDPAPAMKTNEFGDADACLLGCSTSNCTSREIPFVVGGIRFRAPISTPYSDVAVGGECTLNEGLTYKWYSEDYSYGNPKAPSDDFGPGEWGCFRMHWSGWGTDNATIRYWFNDRLVMHVENFDMTDGYWDPNNNRFYPDKAGLGHHRWNHYYNDGYPGDTSYRYEDNFVVTKSAEPVPCEAIGFAF